jgi:uncharacterized protein
MAEKLTFKKFAELVFESEKKPLSPLEIWEKGQELGFSEKLSTSGKTPWQTIGAQIYVDMRDNPKTPFYQYSSRPMKFYLLKNKEDFKPEEASIEEFSEDETQKTKFNERDLHPLLVKFVNSSLNFKAYTKTIYHEIGSKQSKGSQMWLYPDIVGVKLPFDDYEGATLTIQRELFWTAVKFYSFELKKELNRSNLRECYFQAVSNSSWANEGYLIALKIKEDDGNFLKELTRLNNSFGIGCIKLNPENIEQSEIIVPSKVKQEIDWDTVNELLKINKNFKDFIEIVKDDINLGKIANKSNYDKILSEEEFEKHVKEKGILE